MREVWRERPSSSVTPTKDYRTRPSAKVDREGDLWMRWGEDEGRYR